MFKTLLITTSALVSILPTGAQAQSPVSATYSVPTASLMQSGPGEIIMRRPIPGTSDGGIEVLNPSEQPPEENPPPRDPLPILDENNIFVAYGVCNGGTIDVVCNEYVAGTTEIDAGTRTPGYWRYNVNDAACENQDPNMYQYQYYSSELERPTGAFYVFPHQVAGYNGGSCADYDIDIETNYYMACFSPDSNVCITITTQSVNGEPVQMVANAPTDASNCVQSASYVERAQYQELLEMFAGSGLEAANPEGLAGCSTARPAESIVVHQTPVPGETCEMVTNPYGGVAYNSYVWNCRYAVVNGPSDITITQAPENLCQQESNTPEQKQTIIDVLYPEYSDPQSNASQADYQECMNRVDIEFPAQVDVASTPYSTQVLQTNSFEFDIEKQVCTDINNCTWDKVGELNKYDVVEQHDYYCHRYGSSVYSGDQVVMNVEDPNYMFQPGNTAVGSNALNCPERAASIGQQILFPIDSRDRCLDLFRDISWKSALATQGIDSSVCRSGVSVSAPGTTTYAGSVNLTLSTVAETVGPYCGSTHMDNDPNCNFRLTPRNPTYNGETPTPAPTPTPTPTPAPTPTPTPTPTSPSLPSPTPGVCYGSETVLFNGSSLAQCQEYTYGVPKCATGTTASDPAGSNCWTSIQGTSSCSVYGHPAASSYCVTSGGGGSTDPEPTNASCQDECGEERANGAQWCTANGIGSNPARAARCDNGTIVFQPTISGVACGEATRYQCR